MDMNPYPLDPAEVDRFFQEQALDAVVGISCDDGDCPLARFLNAQYEGSTFLVGLAEYRRVMDDVSLGNAPDVVFPLPEWAQDFVSVVDGAGSWTDDTSVSALDALCFLHAVYSTNEGLLGGLSL